MARRKQQELEAVEAQLGEAVELVSSGIGDDLKERLTSRKFLLTVAAAIGAAASGQWPELVALVVAYLGVEGVIDIKSVGKNVNVVLEDAEARQDDLR